MTATFHRDAPPRTSSGSHRPHSSRSRSNTYSPRRDTTPPSHEMNSPDQQNFPADNFPVQPSESVDGRRRVRHLERQRAPSPDNANLHDRSRYQTSTHPFGTPACRNPANRSCLLMDRVGPCPENQPQSHLDLPRAHWPTPHLRQPVQF